jgi:hypothetical protein
VVALSERLQAGREGLVSQPAGLVSVITSVLNAVFVGLLLFALFQASFLVCLIVGGVVFGACVFFSMYYQHLDWRAQERRLTVLFPSEHKLQQ